MSYALEGGASGIAIPWPGAESFQSIKTMTGDLPVWLKPLDLDPIGADVIKALELGAVGIWLGDNLFAESDPAATAQAFRSLVHTPAPEAA